MLFLFFTNLTGNSLVSKVMADTANAIEDGIISGFTKVYQVSDMTESGNIYIFVWINL